MNVATNQTNFEDIGKLVLRATLAILILFHGIAKIVGGAGFITELVAKAGLPASFGYLVFVGEVLAPISVLLGLWARAGALVIAINMLVAIMLVHMADLFSINQTGGWALELQAMFLATAITVSLLGAGRYSLQGTSNRWN